MPNPTVSPNMTLILPVPGVDTGPEWATLLYNALNNQVDSHNHSNGQGVQIQPSGLDISSDLTFNGNNATNLSSVVFGAAGTLSSQSLYVNGGDLYYKNSGGTAVQVTLGNAVNATSSGITGTGGASAAFSSGVLVVQSTSTLPGNINLGSLLLALNSTSANRLTLSPPSGLSAASYGLFLPTQPTNTSFMQLDSSGNMTASIPVTQGITAGNIANGTITSTQIGTQALAYSNLPLVNYSVVGITNTLASSATFITVGTVSLTISGLRPVRLFTTSGNGATGGAIISANGTTSPLKGDIRFFNSTLSSVVGGSVVGTPYVGTFYFSANYEAWLPIVGSISSGTYVFTVQIAWTGASAGTIQLNNMTFWAVEM